MGKTNIKEIINQELIYGISLGDILFVVGLFLILGKLQGWF